MKKMIDIIDIKNAKYLKFYSNDGYIYCKNKITDEVVFIAEDEKYKILKNEYLDYQKWYREEKNKNMKQKEILNKLIKLCHFVKFLYIRLEVRKWNIVEVNY